MKAFREFEIKTLAAVDFKEAETGVVQTHEQTVHTSLVVATTPLSRQQRNVHHDDYYKYKILSAESHENFKTNLNTE